MRKLLYLCLLLMSLVACGGAQATPMVTARPTSADTVVTDTTVVNTAVVTTAATNTLISTATTVLPTDTTAATNTRPATNTAAPVIAQTSGGGSLPDGVLMVVESPTGKQLALFNTDGTSIPVVDGLDRNAHVDVCGENSVTPDGRHTALFIGGPESGTLYLMNGTGMPVSLGEAEFLACVLGNARFNADGSRYAYISYEPGTSRQEFARGDLRLFDTATVTSNWTGENAVSFDISAAGIAYISFYTNNQGEADEAAINFYDYSAEREVATLLPTADNCHYASGVVRQIPTTDQLAVVMGQKCDNETQMRWQLYTIDNQGSATLAASDTQPGDFVVFARNNNIFTSPDGSFLYFTVPDGVTANTVAIAAISRSDVTVSVPVQRQALFPTFRGLTQAEPRLSPDGRWLSFTLTSPQNDNQLYTLDLLDRNNPPISISAGARGDAISALEFTPNSGRVVYVSGSTEGGDNSLFALDLAAGTESRVRRGTFATQLVVAPDNERAAVSNYETAEEGTHTYQYLSVKIVNLNSNTETTLFDDTTSPADQRISAYPIAWVSGS
ncbi:MAG: hypothetical protein U0670_06510 [Anaerolineae bacterium]